MTSASELPVTWRKSSHSNDNGDCVEAAFDYTPGTVPVRDSKDPHGPALVFPAAAWQAFLSGVVAGDFPAS